MRIKKVGGTYAKSWGRELQAEGTDVKVLRWEELARYKTHQDRGAAVRERKEVVPIMRWWLVMRHSGCGEWFGLSSKSNGEGPEV